MKGKLLQQKYSIIKTLSQDVFSKTFLAQDQNWYSRRYCVIKQFKPILGNYKVRNVKLLFYQEASVLRRLGSQNSQIPQLYEYLIDGENFYLVREWIKGITLEQKVQQQGRLSATEVKSILSSLLSFLKYIHGHQIVYQELKPSSIVLRANNRLYQYRNQACLPVPIYFGGVKNLAIEAEKLNQGSIGLTNQHEYSSPEQKVGESVYASDIYSLGLIAIYLLTGKTPNQLTRISASQELLWHQEFPDLETNLVRTINRAVCPNLNYRFASPAEMLRSLHAKPIVISESLIHQPTERNYLTPEVKIVSILSFVALGVIGLALNLLSFDFTQFIESEEIDGLSEVTPELH